MICMKKLYLVLAVSILSLGVISGGASAGTIAYYSFDGADVGPAYTVSGATIVSGGGYGGTNAYSFDGSNDYLSAPVNINPTTLPKMTMGAWVKATSVSAVRQVISSDNDGYDRSLCIDNRGGGLGWSAFSGTGHVLGYEPVTLDKWTFVAVVYDEPADSVMLYVDGETFSETGSLGPGKDYIRIGSNPQYGEFFSGIIDNVFIMDEVLSKEQLDAMRCGVVSTPEPSLVFLLISGIAGLIAVRRRFKK